MMFSDVQGTSWQYTSAVLIRKDDLLSPRYIIIGGDVRLIWGSFGSRTSEHGKRIRQVPIPPLPSQA